MQRIRQIDQLNKRELEDCTPPEASWHRDYSDTAYIYIGGLDDRLSEGDILTVFSQFGEPDFLNLVRDKETGKSKGFAFLRYKDQRSCDLAVDNIGGAKVLGRLLSVDHTRYNAKDGEDLSDNTRPYEWGSSYKQGVEDEEHDTEIEDVSDSPNEIEYNQPPLQEEIELQKLLEMDDEDPMKLTLVQQKRDELQLVKSNLKSNSSRGQRPSKNKDHRHRSLQSKSASRYQGNNKKIMSAK